MPTKIKVIRTREFLQTTQDGELDLSASKQMLLKVASARRPPADFDVLLDVRRAHWRLNTFDIYQLATALSEHHDLRTAKIAVLVLPGTDFNAAQFLETCSVNRGMQVDTFTSFEDAIQWFFTSEDIADETPNNAMDSDEE